MLVSCYVNVFFDFCVFIGIGVKGLIVNEGVVSRWNLDCYGWEGIRG